MTYTFTDDYKNEFKSYVDSLYKSNITDVETKKAEIESLNESYFEVSGKVPDSVQLDRLSTWLLKGIEHEDKKYDVKTRRQLQRIHKEREVMTDATDVEVITHDKDGNRHKGQKITADTEGSHRVSVVLDYDREKDKRKYNAPVNRYRQTL